MNPVHDRVAVEHPPPLLPPHEGQALLDEVAGPGEGVVQLVRGAPVLLAGDGPGGLEDGDLVEEFAAPQAVVDEVALRADVHHDLAEVEALDPRLLGGHGAAVGDVRRGDGFVVDEQLARGRVEAVGREDQARLVDLTGGEGDAGAASGVLVRHDPRVVDQLDARALAGAEQQPVQVAAAAGRHPERRGPRAGEGPCRAAVTKPCGGADSGGPRRRCPAGSVADRAGVPVEQEARR